MSSVLVVGQIARDLVLEVDSIPSPGGSARVRARVEVLGGNGANQAVGLRQLAGPEGPRVSLLGVAGTDATGDAVLRQARADGVHVDDVVRRGTTALLVDVVEPGGSRRLIEHVPAEAELTPQDVHRADRAGLLRADWVCVQLQQPDPAVLEAVRAARRAGARVLVDGAATSATRDELLREVDVLRADADEAQSWVDGDAMSPSATLDCAHQLVEAGPEVVALAVRDRGDAVAWRGGERYLPHRDDAVVDPTGAGDAFVAGLLTGLIRGGPRDAAALAGACAAATVKHAGGRPRLRARRPAQ